SVTAHQPRQDGKAADRIPPVLREGGQYIGPAVDRVLLDTPPDEEGDVRVVAVLLASRERGEDRNRLLRRQPASGAGELPASDAGSGRSGRSRRAVRAYQSFGGFSSFTSSVLDFFAKSKTLTLGGVPKAMR